ncbi:hypothetical protein VNI00_013204 [Paramarasmius palmivorus]|uniref:Uncharacterized protein n=1 Tax=Paramarasmius palmivorus TaxID=297713 RepID=A0AAW0C172_9AGAR
MEPDGRMQNEEEEEDKKLTALRRSAARLIRFALYHDIDHDYDHRFDACLYQPAKLLSRALHLAFVGALLTLGGAQENGTQSSEWSESSWASIEPSKDLQWVKCYDGPFECGRLQVPLNYSNPDGESAAIALIRIKANVSTDSTEYRGPILFNPGGPGGGGIDLIIARGPLLAQIVGPQFDVVAFDPRGIAHSTPRIEFFESREERALWYIPAASELNHSSIDVASFWARHKVNGQLVQERFIDLLPYFTTSHVAQDMLRIAEAHGKEKLQYWGFSFAETTLKDKVERLIIDGIVDVENDYYTTEWKGIPLDLDKALDWFFKDCLDAGPEACPFHDTSIEAMRERLNKLYESVIKAPVAVRTEVSYGLVDYGNLRGLILIGLYSPLRWPRLAAGLAGLEAGNGTALWRLGADVPPFSCSCDSSEFAFENVLDARQVYVCNDGDVVSSSLEDAQKHYEESVKISEWNSLFAAFKIECSSWPRIPRDFFRGPISGNTSYPLLIIGNTADPATPLRNAHIVSKGFPGSVVLTQDSSGHASINSPSICTNNAVRAYFVNGTLPEPGTVCSSFTNPFITNSTTESNEARAFRRGFCRRGY